MSKTNKLKEKHFGFVEGIVYILLIIVVIATSITGPVIIKLLPLIFILGIVGRALFDRPIVTSIFGFVISMCIIDTIGTYSMEYNLTYSLFCFMSILIGEITGLYLIRYINNKKNKEKKGNFKYIIIIFLFSITGIWFNSYVNGNFYSYFKCKNKIENYISINYPSSNNIKIIDGKYVLDKYNYYSFNVMNIDEINNIKYEFAIYLDDKIIDGYKDSNLIYLNKQLKDEFENSIDLSIYNSFDVEVKYIDLKKNITLYITNFVDELSFDELNKFSKNVNNILDSISKFSKFDNIIKLNISIEDSQSSLNAEINKENFYNNDYYINSLETEFLDK